MFLQSRLTRILPGTQCRCCLFYIKICIKDSGIGLEEKIVDNIFDPYFSTKGDKGTGLGLSQVYSFIQEEHGAITVESSLNGGTIFKLYFPRFVVSEEQTEADNTVLSDLNAYHERQPKPHHYRDLGVR